MEKEELKLLTETTERSKSNTKRINRLEGIFDAVHGMARDMAVMNLNVERMSQSLANIEKRVAKIEDRELNETRKTKWELKRSLINAFVGVIVGGIVTYIIMIIGMMS